MDMIIKAAGVIEELEAAAVESPSPARPTLTSLADALAQVLSYLPPADLRSAEASCTELAAAAHYLWRANCLRACDAAEMLVFDSHKEWKALCAEAQSTRRSGPLLMTSLGASSTDRPEECINNVLQQSQCIRTSNQITCDCHPARGGTCGGLKRGA